MPPETEPNPRTPALLQTQRRFLPARNGHKHRRHPARSRLHGRLHRLTGHLQRRRRRPIRHRRLHHAHRRMLRHRRPRRYPLRLMMLRRARCLRRIQQPIGQRGHHALPHVRQTIPRQCRAGAVQLLRQHISAERRMDSLCIGHVAPPVRLRPKNDSLEG